MTQKFLGRPCIFGPRVARCGFSFTARALTTTRRERKRPMEAAAVPREGRYRLRTPAVCVEPATSPSFPARSRTTRTSDPVGVATGFADGEFDLTGEGQIARVDARSRASGSPRTDAEIVHITESTISGIAPRYMRRRLRI
jgi:hypothetical protein